MANKILSVDKPIGSIDPFDSIDLSFTFHVDCHEKQSGFIIDNKSQKDKSKESTQEDSHKYNYKCLIIVEDLNQRLEIPIEGVAHIPQILINEAEFFF